MSNNLNKYKNLPFTEQIRLPLNVQIRLHSAGLMKQPSGPAIQKLNYGVPTWEAPGTKTFNANLNKALANIRGTYPAAPALGGVGAAAASAASALTPSFAAPAPSAPAVPAGKKGLTIRLAQNRKNLTMKPVVPIRLANNFGFTNPLHNRKGKGGKRRTRRNRRR